MKLVILLIIAASLNISLLNKNNELNVNVLVTNAKAIVYNEVLITKHGRKQLVKSLKHKILTQINTLSNHVINILIRTNIISAKKAKTLQSYTLKPISKKSDRTEKNLQI